jgi:hypothetical protein
MADRPFLAHADPDGGHRVALCKESNQELSFDFETTNVKRCTTVLATKHVNPRLSDR